MDPRRNPYAPGAGSSPPELAGRDAVLETIAIGLDRVREGLDAKNALLVGLRGVGKTVLLNRIADDAETRGIVRVQLEAVENRSLPSMLAPPLRRALLTLDRLESAKAHLLRAWRGLAGFVGAARVSYRDVEIRIDMAPEPGLADTGDLENDLVDLLRVVGEAARERRGAVALFVDELQYVAKTQLAALITALHACRQRRLPVALVGAGLPQLVGNVGRAKSYSERLFDCPEIGRLDRGAAFRALRAPAEREDVRFDDAALERILDRTGGIPTSCRNGAPTPGGSRRRRRLRAMMSAAPRTPPSRRSTRDSSASATTVAPGGSGSTFWRWRGWGRGLTAPATSPESCAAPFSRSRPCAAC